MNNAIDIRMNNVIKAFDKIAEAAADMGPYLATMGYHLQEIHSLLAEAAAFELAVMQVAAVTNLPVDQVAAMLRNHPSDWRAAVVDLFADELLWYGTDFFGLEAASSFEGLDIWLPPPAGRYWLALGLLLVVLTWLIY